LDSLSLLVSFIPLAIYLFILGAMNLARRPRLVTGAVDTFALAVALGGFMLVGPMRLFVPQAAASQFGPFVWILLLAFYYLGVTLWVLLARPRLVIYNISGDQLQALVAGVAERLDAESRWAGDSLSMPQLGVQLHLDAYRPMRNVVLASTGERQSYTGWRNLRRALLAELQRINVERNPRGVSFITAGLALIGWPLWLIRGDPLPVAQQLKDMLQL